MRRRRGPAWLHIAPSRSP
uniref:Uncharacterized protein n=1 Tax=Arundo donax TaxID=35708 RepID=A0A0A9C256_ARUDO